MFRVYGGTWRTFITSQRYVIQYLSFQACVQEKRISTLCALQTLERAKRGIVVTCWSYEENRTPEVDYCSLSVGLSFLAIIILSHWSSNVKLLGLDGNYTGKKSLHLFRLLAPSFWRGRGVKKYAYRPNLDGGTCLGISFNFSQVMGNVFSGIKLHILSNVAIGPHNSPPQNWNIIDCYTTVINL